VSSQLNTPLAMGERWKLGKNKRPGGLKLVKEIGNDEDMEGSGSKDDHFDSEVFPDREPV